MSEQEAILYREAYIAALQAALSRCEQTPPNSPQSLADNRAAHAEALCVAITAVNAYRAACRDFKTPGAHSYAA